MQKTKIKVPQKHIDITTKQQIQKYSAIKQNTKIQETQTIQ